MPKLIFISHRHDDEKIATVFYDHLQDWGVNQDDIFYSSDVEQGPVIGGPLKTQLKKALAESKLVLLIYTESDENWEYCVWEAGVATDPREEPQDTRVVVFQFGREQCRVYQDELSFRFDKEDIKRFVYQFHHNQGFFLEGKAFQPKTQPKILDQKAERLFNDLKEVAPKEDGGKARDVERWDHFRLLLPKDSVEQVKTITKENLENDGKQDKLMTVLMQNAKVSYSFGSALEHFHYAGIEDRLTLEKLVSKWRDRVNVLQGKNPTTQPIPDGWIRELCMAMVRAINYSPSEPFWELMKSSLYPDWWFYPVLNHAKVQANGSMEFDIYMYRVPGKLPSDVTVNQQ